MPIEDCRNDFPLLAHLHYLDSASVSLTPVQVVDVVREFDLPYGQTCGAASTASPGWPRSGTRRRTRPSPGSSTATTASSWRRRTRPRPSTWSRPASPGRAATGS